MDGLQSLSRLPLLRAGCGLTKHPSSTRPVFRLCPMTGCLNHTPWPGPLEPFPCLLFLWELRLPARSGKLTWYGEGPQACHPPWGKAGFEMVCRGKLEEGPVVRFQAENLGAKCPVWSVHHSGPAPISRVVEEEAGCLVAHVCLSHHFSASYQLTLDLNEEIVFHQEALTTTRPRRFS